MQEKEMTFTVVEKDGNEVECEVLFTFEADGKNFIVYTDNGVDEEDGCTRVFASIYNLDEDEQLLSLITSDAKWALVESILNELQSGML